MIKMTSEIPFHKGSPRLIPWIISLMIYLATLSVALSITIQRFIENWQSQTGQNFTISVPAQESIASNTESPSPALPSPQQEILNTLKNIPQIKSAQVMAFHHSSLSPTDDASIPTRIEVKLFPQQQIELRDLEEKLSSLAPGIMIQNQSIIKQNIIGFSEIVRVGSLGFAGLITFIAMITIAFITHTGLTLHEEAIDILQLLGARNSYIAKQFQRHTLQMGIKGALAAIFFSSITYYGFHHVLNDYGATLEPLDISLYEVWSIILMTPIFVILLVLLSARITVSFSLLKRV